MVSQGLCTRQVSCCPAGNPIDEPVELSPAQNAIVEFECLPNLKLCVNESTFMTFDRMVNAGNT